MMTREEAIKSLQNIVEHWTYNPTDVEAAKMAISTLRPVSREQVEKAWRSEWDSNGPRDIVVYCKQCMMPQDVDTNFCHSCGAAMTDEAMEMVMERLEALYETT